MTQAKVKLTEAQRGVLRWGNAAFNFQTQSCWVRGPLGVAIKIRQATLSRLVRLGFMNKTSSHGHDDIYHITSAGRSALAQAGEAGE